jgi:membrane protein
VSSVPPGRPDEAQPDGAPLPRAAVRAIQQYRARQMTDRAASLTYYAMLSLFPAVLAGVTLLGLFGGQDLVTKASKYVLDKGADPATAKVVEQVLSSVTDASSGTLGVALFVSVALALNGASGAFAAAGRALNEIHGVVDERGFVHRKLNDLGITLVVLLLLIVVLVAVFLGGGIVSDLSGTLGLGDTGATVWRIVRWPLALLAAVIAYGLVYSHAPAVRRPGFRWISPGSAFGVALWLVASAGFAIYIQNFSNYGAAYGVAGAAIVLLLWLFLSANAFLLGAQLDFELERGRSTGPAAARD